MIMRTIYFTFPLLVAFLISTCALESQSQSRQERPVESDFNEISVSSGVDLIVKQGSPAEIIVEADSDDIDDVKTEIKGGKLNVYFDGSVFSWFQSSSAKVYVTTEEIKKLSASSGADLKSVGEIEGESLEISSSGGADVEVSVKADNVILNSSGGADLMAEGETDYLEAHSSGGADIKARQLIAKRVKVSSSGGADVEVYASDEIEASASGGADVDYYGGAKAKKISESGGGDVTSH